MSGETGSGCGRWTCRRSTSWPPARAPASREEQDEIVRWVRDWAGLGGRADVHGYLQWLLLVDQWARDRGVVLVNEGCSPYV